MKILALFIFIWIFSSLFGSFQGIYVSFSGLLAKFMTTVLLYKKFVTPFSNDCSIIKICSHFRGSASTSYRQLRRLCQSFMRTPVAFLSPFPGDFATLMNFSERLSKCLQRFYSYFQESCKKNAPCAAGGKYFGEYWKKH